MSHPEKDGDDIEYNDNEENELALDVEEDREEMMDTEEKEEEEEEEEEEKTPMRVKEDLDEDEDEDSEAMGWGDDEGDDEEEMMYGDAGDEEAYQDTDEDIHSEKDEDNEDDDDDRPHRENYLQKLDERVKKDYLHEIHPEAFLHNYEEVKAMCQITRDENYRIIDPLHKTLPFLTKYERTRLLGMRAKQLNAGATPLVEVPETMLDGQLIAERELQERKLPFVLRRPLPNGTFEYWRVSDLELI